MFCNEDYGFVFFNNDSKWTSDKLDESLLASTIITNLSLWRSVIFTPDSSSSSATDPIQTTCQHSMYWIFIHFLKSKKFSKFKVKAVIAK